MKAAAKQLEFEKAAKLRDQLGVLRQRWSDMHSAGESKLKKTAPSKGRKRTSQKSKQIVKKHIDYIDYMCDNIDILFHVSNGRDDAVWYHLFKQETK